MLGTVGFGAAAAVLFVYALSTKKYGNLNKNFKHTEYFLAYLSMALAMIVWAVGTQSSESMLKSSVIIGDALVMVSTALLVKVIADKKWLNLSLVVTFLVACGLLYYRALNNEPLMKSGVLVFNTPRLFGALLVVILLVVWFRANLKYYELEIRSKMKNDVLRPNFFTANLLGYIAVSGFLFARKLITITLAFSMLVLAFIILTSLNYYSDKLSSKGDSDV